MLPNFFWPCFRQQPSFIGLSGNDHCINLLIYFFNCEVKPIYSLSGHSGCFVKCFYFVWSELVWSCQECLGEGAAVAVSSRWAVGMAKVAVRTGCGWGVAGNVNVMSCSECRPIWCATVNGICSIWTIPPSLRQFNRCPSWFVNQWKQKGFWVVLVPPSGIYMKRKEIENRCHLWRILIYYLLEKPFIMYSFTRVNVSKDVYLPYINNFDLLTLFNLHEGLRKHIKTKENMNWIVTLHLQLSSVEKL